MEDEIDALFAEEAAPPATNVPAEDEIDSLFSAPTPAQPTQSRFPTGATVDEEKDIVTDLPYESPAILSAPNDFRPVKSGARADLTTPIENDFDRRAIYNQMVEGRNQRMYESVGEQGGSFLGMDMPRVQIGRDGNRYYVPRPGGSTVADVVGGSVLEAAEGVGRFGEFVTDKMGITDPNTRAVEQAFPDIAASPNEQVAIEIGSSLIGGLAGGAAAGPAAARLAGKYGLRFLTMAGGDPVRATQMATKFAGTVGAASGANFGAAVTVADSVDPLIVADLAQRTGLDPDSARYLGLWTEGMVMDGALSVAGRVLKKPVGAAAEFGKKLFGANPDEKNMVIAIMTDIGEFEKGVPGTEIVRRADAMSKVLGKYGMAPDTLTRNPQAIKLDTPSTLLFAAREYVDEAYAIEKQVLSPDEWTRFANAKSNAVAEKLLNTRSSLLSDPTVRNAAVRPNVMAREQLGRFSDELVDADLPNASRESMRQDSARRLAQPLADDLNTVLDDEALKLAERDQARFALDEVLSKDQIAQDISRELKSNIMLDSRQTDDVVKRLMREDLYDSFTKSYENYSNLFDSVPEGVKVDLKPLIKEVEDLAKRTSDFDFITTNATAKDPLRTVLEGIRPRDIPMPGPGGQTFMRKETLDEVAARLEASGVDYKQLFNDIRPRIGDAISGMYNSNRAQEANMLRAFRETVDKTLDTVDEPTARKAMEAFKEHKAKFESNPALEQFADLAKRVRADGRGSSEFKARAAGDIFGTLKDNDVYFGDLSRALGAKGSAELNDALTKQAITDAANQVGSRQRPNADAIVKAFGRYRDALDPTTISKVETSVQVIREAERGLASADEAYEAAQSALKHVQDEANRRKAAEFLSNLDGRKVVTQDIDKVFAERIFGADKPADAVADLIRQADGDKDIIDGIKSQWVRYLSNKAFGASSLGIDLASDGAIPRGNQGFLSGVRKDLANPAVSVTKELFKDNPEQGEELLALLDFQSLITTGQSIRTAVAGSDTAYKAQQAQNIRTVIAVTLGRLNRAATTTNAIASVFASANEKQIEAAARQIAVNLIADPDYMKKALQGIVKGYENSAVLKNLSREIIKSTARSAASPEPVIPGEKTGGMLGQMRGAFGIE